MQRDHRTQKQSLAKHGCVFNMARPWLDAGQIQAPKIMVGALLCNGMAVSELFLDSLKAAPIFIGTAA